MIDLDNYRDQLRQPPAPPPEPEPSKLSLSVLPYATQKKVWAGAVEHFGDRLPAVLEQSCPNTEGRFTLHLLLGDGKGIATWKVEGSSRGRWYPLCHGELRAYLSACGYAFPGLEKKDP